MRKYTKAIAALLACTAAAGLTYACYEEHTPYEGGMMSIDDYTRITQETTSSADSSQTTTTTTEAASLAVETTITDAIEK
ncbi:hypothetical protein [uncultured Ruminococcus sp.]|uniref:hypothetical protein n=1 Tax=uncultured Ruminococcus sp. TaxID=165186 RepID=UPI002630EC22|nr:hypothetical protein [uncultured Ruminococcus sp.]